MRRILLEEFLETQAHRKKLGRTYSYWYRCTCGKNEWGFQPSLDFQKRMHRGERYRIVKVYGWRK